MSNFKPVIKKLEKIKNNIAKERDKLREVLDAYHDILDTSDVAVADIEEAIDTLSQYL